MDTYTSAVTSETTTPRRPKRATAEGELAWLTQNQQMTICLMKYSTYRLDRVAALEATSVALIGWANSDGRSGLSGNIIQTKYNGGIFNTRHTGVTTTVVVTGILVVPMLVIVTVEVTVVVVLDICQITIESVKNKNRGRK